MSGQGPQFSLDLVIPKVLASVHTVWGVFAYGPTAKPLVTSWDQKGRHRQLLSVVFCGG